MRQRTDSHEDRKVKLEDAIKNALGPTKQHQKVIFLMKKMLIKVDLKFLVKFKIMWQLVVLMLERFKKSILMTHQVAIQDVELQLHEVLPRQNNASGAAPLIEIDINIPREAVGVVTRGGGSGVVAEQGKGSKIHDDCVV